ncbi:MAG: hypothetical protein WC975_11250 [Phycisphaerae bacterium]
MAGEHNEFKVGLTVTMVVIVFVAVLVFIGKWDTLFQSVKPLEVRFIHSTGIQSLRVKDPVRIGGMNVGRVEKTWLQMDQVMEQGKPSAELYVHVLAQIPSDVKIYTDSRITIGTKFVGEGGTLDIQNTGRKGKLVTPGEVIDGIAPGGFSELTDRLARELDEKNPDSLLSQIKKQLDVENANSLIAKIHKSMDDLNAVTTQVKGQLNEKEKASLLAKIQATMDNLKSVTASARKMIDDASPKISATVAHINNTAHRVDEDISVNLANELDKTDNGSLLFALHGSLASAQAGMDNLKMMTQTGKDVLVLNRDNLQAIIDNFAETSAHLKTTAKEVRRNPWRLLYTPNKPEAEYANLMESARAFSDAAGSLDQANSRLKQLTDLHPNTVGSNDPQMGKVREQIKKAVCQFEQAQKKLWEMLKLKS